MPHPKAMDSAVVEIVRRVLNELGPENVDSSAVTATGEGSEVEIVIVPHRDLGGVSLVLWTDNNGTQLVWAGIGDLSNHDDIDLGEVVKRIPHEGDWGLTLRDAINAEFRRPIRLNYRRGFLARPRIDCYVTVGDKEKRLAVLRPNIAQRRTNLEPIDAAITSLASGRPAWFSIPPSLDEWRRHA
jgi:hypothetical protein